MTNRIIAILILLPTLCFAQWTQVVNAINGQNAGDAFGYSTAISADGTIVAIGANSNDDGGGSAGQCILYSPRL